MNSAYIKFGTNINSIYNTSLFASPAEITDSSNSSHKVVKGMTVLFNDDNQFFLRASNKSQKRGITGYNELTV